VRDIAIDESSVSAKLTGLLANTEYTVIFEYPDGNSSSSKQISFKTLESFAPEITVSGISTPTATRKRLDFSLNVSDVSGICTVTKIALWMDGAVLKTLELKETYTFADINIYGKYSLKVYYEYDLCDGNGKVSKTQNFDFEPYTVYLPEPSISSATIGNNYVQFMLNITGNSLTGNIEKIEFYDGEKLMGSSPVSGSYSFYGLKPLKKYTVRVYFCYDVGDGISKGTTYKDLSIGTQSEGLAVSDGFVTGVGTNKDKVLYINMPIKNADPLAASYSGAFSGNTNITAVYMGSGVTSIRPSTSDRYEYYDWGIAQYSFKGCTNLKTVVLPNTITAILANTFRDCTSLETITIPENVLAIMSYAFTGTGIKYVYVHEALDDLRANAFSNDCILLYEGEKAHENWQKGWDTYRQVIYNVAGVENVGGTAYAVLKDGSKVSLDVPYVEPNNDIPMPDIKPEPNVELKNVKYGEKTLSFDCLLFKNDLATAEIQKLELYLGDKPIETAGAGASYSFASLPHDAIYTAKIYVSYKLTGSSTEAPQTLVITKECIQQSEGLK
ncbi:MAG: leucine-rich repeat domain-containing protein, partial [Clostridia bacterium]|nr:leucine-rich repeat domain-containing protein [Clostridia bacterium]